MKFSKNTKVRATGEISNFHKFRRKKVNELLYSKFSNRFLKNFLEGKKETKMIKY